MFISFRYALPKHRMMSMILMFMLAIDVWLDYWIQTNRTQLPQRARKIFLRILYVVIAGFIAMLVAFWIVPFACWTPILRTYVIGVILIFVTLKMVLASVFFLQFLISKINGINKIASPKCWFKAGIWVAVLMFVVTLYGSIYEVFDLRVQHIEIKDKSVPKAFDGYKIVQFSDMHIGSQVSERYVKKLVDSINAQSPDVVVFTGDMVNLNTDEILPYVSLFSEIRVKEGVYVIFGNHDYSGYLNWKTPKDSLDNIQRLLDIYQSLNWRVLQNEHIYCRRGDDSIVLAGVEDYSGKKSKRRKSLADTKKALHGTTPTDFTVLLSHNPKHFEEEVEVDYPQVNLTLSGHSHGGQIAVGVGESKFSAAQLSMRYWQGVHRIGNQYLLVNTGCGFNMYPFRINMPPSISVITLKP